MFPECDWTVYIRMSMLVWIVSKKFGHLKRDDAATEQAWLEDLAANAMSLNRNLQVHPEWPQIYARSGGPMFWLLENLTAQGLTTELLPALENFRSGNLSYLMLTSPPRPTAEEAGAAAELLRKEGELLEELKGCYFLLLNPVLPSHYKHFDVDIRDPSLMRGLDFKGAPEAYARTRKELTDLHEQMKSLAPRYADRRLRPTADLDRLAEALRAHRPPGE
jgi:hypothetical protein